MTIYDLVGLTGTVIMLGTYALTVAGRIDAQRVPGLLGNFAGAALVLVSLSHDFNLSAVIVETVWALIAATGLLRLALRRAS